MNSRIITVLLLAIFVAMLGLGIIGPLMPVYAKNMGATGILLGVIFSAFSISRLIFMPLGVVYIHASGICPYSPGRQKGENGFYHGSI